MPLTDCLSFLWPVPRPSMRRKSWRRSQRTRVARRQYADAFEPQIAMEQIFHLQVPVTGTSLAGSKSVTPNFHPSSDGLASMSPVDVLPVNIGDERNPEGPTWQRSVRGRAPPTEPQAPDDGGTDKFTYRAFDGHVQSEKPATVRSN